MVMWPINHIHFRLKSYIPQPQLFSPLVRFRHRYDPSFILASTRIQPSQPISTSSLRRRSPTSHWTVADQARMLEHKLIEKLLARCREHFRARKSNRYNQWYSQSNAVRAIKAIWSTIRPEQCDQSDMTSNTIRTNPGVVTIILPITPTQRSGIGFSKLGVWNRGYRG